jgi:hypothetical protein
MSRQATPTPGARPSRPRGIKFPIRTNADNWCGCRKALALPLSIVSVPPASRHRDLGTGVLATCSTQWRDKDFLQASIV